MSKQRGGATLSSFSLRLIALLSMFFDHAGLSLFPHVGLLRAIGRISFPLYCFLLVQGFLHTRDVRAYGRRLLLCAILSEIPFDLLIFNRFSSPMEQNVLFSLLFALMALVCCDTLAHRPLQALILSIMLATSAMALRLSYGWLSVALCLGFYYARENRLQQIGFSGGALVLNSLSLLLSGVDRGWALTSFTALLSLIPIGCYNRRPGPRHPLLSFVFYAFYPAHLLLLFWLRVMRIIPPYFLR